MPVHTTDRKNRKKKQKKFCMSDLLIAAVIILAVLIGVVCYVLYDNLEKKREQQKQELYTLMDGCQELPGYLQTVEERLQKLVPDNAEAEEWKAFTAQADTLKSDDIEEQILLVTQIKAFEQKVESRARDSAEKLLDELKAQKTGYASDSQKDWMITYGDTMEHLIEEGDYRNLDLLARKWRDYAEKAAEKKTGYRVEIVQYDLSAYPKVRLYLNVVDERTGKIVQGLSPNMFLISERDAKNGDFLNRAVQKAVMLNENERLNLNLLADTSGSMAGGSMDAAKNIMKNFLNTVQFTAGDQIKLTQFNSIIDKSGVFSNDLQSLYTIIDSYYPGGQTKLYDSIIYGVQDVSGQEGARCVIAFTDGRDEGSYHSADQVVDLVARYKIPVFIVRIGDSSSAAGDDELRRIARASGGDFKNIQQFSADLGDFYDQIYRQIKEYYVVEYESEDSGDITQNTEISVYIQRGDMGGSTTADLAPKSEQFDSLLGSYLRSYIHDMNQHAYDWLRQYVDDTVEANDERSIQWQMKTQVTGGFNNVESETLMDYQITAIEMVDETTMYLKTSENYDVMYEEIYGDLITSDRKLAKEQLAYLQSRFAGTEAGNNTRIRFWARVNQTPEYILKKGQDGNWRFSRYTGALGLNAQRQLYDVEIMK